VSGPYVLEISVENLECALAAQRGGANRLELCADLASGGLTPSTELMRRVRAEVRAPIFAMVRPRGGHFVYSEAEFESMRRDIDACRELGMDGCVFGLLTEDRHVDVARTQKLVEFARPLPVTFHRAFDECADLRESLEEVIATGAARILTSGGAATAAEGLMVLRKLVAAGGERILILPGSGINATNIAEVARGTQAGEFHSGLGSVRIYGTRADASFENEVRKLRTELLRAWPGSF
jgi:copper homeostasis protein